MICSTVTLLGQLQANGHLRAGGESQVKGQRAHHPSPVLVQSGEKWNPQEKWGVEAGSSEPELEIGQADKPAAGGLEGTLKYRGKWADQGRCGNNTCHLFFEAFLFWQNFKLPEKLQEY